MVTTQLQGRLGNQFYQIAMLLAYCKKHNLQYYIPNKAYHCDGTKVYFPELSMGPELKGLKEFHEQVTHAVAKGDGTYNYNVPSYKDIPAIDNIKFIGYWQTFKYIDWCRDYILEKFAIPWQPTSMVSIHVRRGDFVQLADKHPPLPISYYYNAIEYFQRLGYNDFLVFSDDIEWCKSSFNSPSANIMFQEGQSEYTDFWCMASCEHHILCYSTFGFVAAWLNQNPNKHVLIPESKYCFSGAHTDFIPDYFKQIEI